MKENIAKNEKNSNINREMTKNRLNDIFHDRQRGSGSGKFNFPVIADDNPDSLEKNESENIDKNILLLSFLNGHSGSELRKLIRSSSTDEAGFLKRLYDWSLEAIKKEKLSFNGAVKDAPPFLLDNIKDTTDLYERMVFLDNHPDIDREAYESILTEKTSRAVGVQSGKWTDMVDKVFREDPESTEKTVKALLENIGFIPSELLTKKKFKGVGGKNVAKVLNILRGLEKTDLKEKALNERAKLINFIFTSNNANSVRRKSTVNITLDSNGLFINLTDLHAHLPFGLVSDECLETLRKDNWLAEDRIQEARQRMNEENSRIKEKKSDDKEQLALFSEKLGLNVSEQEDIIRELTARISVRPDEFAGEVTGKSLIIPDLLIRKILSSNDYNKIYAVLRVAEVIGIDIGNEQIRNEAGLFESHKIMDHHRESYLARAKVLNDPHYYNAVKIIKSFLNQSIESDPSNNFLVFKGKYGKSKQGDQHSFIEVMHNGDLARILVNEEKHLANITEANLKKISEFQPEEYKTLEDALRAFNYFSSSVVRLKKIKENKHKNWRSNFVSLSETGLHFLLSNVTGHYQEALGLYHHIKFDSDVKEEAYDELIKIFKTAKNEYSEFFYHNTGDVLSLKEKFSPEVNKFDLTFDRKILDLVKKHSAEDGYTPELYESGHQARICLLHYKTGDPTETIPYHIEESCIGALRIQRDRPLINVIGGCRFIEGKNPLESFGSSVISVADKHKANVGVPGTDSGIGAVFGKRNIEYQNRTSHLPAREKAHLFAINPGGNTYVPENKYVKNAAREEVFANTPVDSIITPFPADWDLRGKDKYHTRYLNHVAYMEAFYQRIGYGQPKVMVVGNGGLYSIFEINESIERGFGLMLVKDSGRFAEVAAVLMEHIDELDIGEDKSAISKNIISIIGKKASPEVAEEFMKKDFGFRDDPETEEYEVYRNFFFKFLRLAKMHKDRIRVTGLENLRSDLDKYLGGKG